MKQSLKITALSLALAVPMVLPLSTSAAMGFGEWHTTLVQRLAQKLGVQQTQVQSVFDEVRNEKQAEMQKKLEERLTQAVKEGKITEAQKQLLLTKHKQMQDEREKNRETWQNMTPEQRRDAQQKARTELEAWAKANNISLEWLMMGHGMGKMGRHMWK
jgi:hypothetical protein